MQAGMATDNRIYKLPALDQHQSVLFSMLPGELRNLIFQFALSEYERLTQLYDEDTYYYRPGQRSDAQTDTSLLRTCQRIYNESWSFPWLMWESIVYLTEPSRQPGNKKTYGDLQRMLSLIHVTYGEGIARVPSLRVFAQLNYLEAGHTISDLLGMRYFYPVSITISIRHTDWWYWENDEPLKIAAEWVNVSRFPNTVKEVRMELETVERRKRQVQEVAKLMKASWAFVRVDGLTLTSPADEIDRIDHWEGSSILTHQRWLRDESKPGRLQYYIQTVRFSLQHKGKLDGTSSASKDITLAGRGFETTVPGLISASLSEMLARGLAKDAPVGEVTETMSRYTARCWCQNHNGRPRRTETCCRNADSKALGVGWRDNRQRPTPDMCRHCQAENCEIAGARARRRRVRQWAREAQNAEPQNADSMPAVEGEEWWNQMFYG